MSKLTQWIAKKLDVIYYNNPLLNKRNNLYVKQNVQDWAHYVHKAHVIVARAFDFHAAWDREIVSFYHPFQYANIYKVADAISSDKILLLNPADLHEEDPKVKVQLQNKWDKNQGQFLLKKAIEKGRKHGWILYVPVIAKMLPEYYSGPPWHIYSADEAQVVKWDAFGHPIEWTIQPTNKKIDSFQLFVHECFFFDVYLTDDFDGWPEGSQIWDDLIDYIFIKDSHNAFLQRMGNGFLILPVPLGTSPDVKAGYQSKIQNVRTEMGLIWEVDDEPDSALSNQKPEWMTPQGGADFIGQLDKIEDGIATGMGFPKRWLKGDAEGAMESSGKDKLQVHSKLNAIFNQWKRFIIGVCLFHKWIPEYHSIEVRAGFKMELSDEEMVNIDLLKTQTIGAKTWMTVNEQREADGLEPIDEEGADEVMMQEEGGENGGSDKKSSNTQSKPSDAKNDTDPLDALMDVFTNKQISVRQLAEWSGVSPTTISKMRSKFDADLQPIAKMDELVIKEDSVQISDNIYEYEGIVLRPQEKTYDNLNRTCILPQDEIARVFNDPTYPKEFRIGVTKSDDHRSQIPSEVLEKAAIGTVKYERLTDQGIYGKVRIDLNKTDKIIGKDNWMRQKTRKGEFIPMSVARWTVDKPKGDKWIEGNVDIRSYVATRTPRNKTIGVQ